MHIRFTKGARLKVPFPVFIFVTFLYFRISDLHHKFDYKSHSESK